MDDKDETPHYTSRELPRLFQLDFEVQKGAVRLYAGWFWVIVAIVAAVGLHGGCG